MTLDLHNWFSWWMIIANAVVGIWALVAHRREGWRHKKAQKALWCSTIFAQASVFAQAILGTWLIAREGRTAPDLHALYGFSALVAVGIAYSYRQQLQRHTYLLYGITGLFLMGLGIRSIILD